MKKNFKPTPKTNRAVRFLTVLFFVTLAAGLGTYVASVSAAVSTDTWSQNGWQTTPTPGATVVPANKATFSDYYSKHNAVDSSLGGIKFATPAAKSLTHATYNDFYSGGGIATQAVINSGGNVTLGVNLPSGTGADGAFDDTSLEPTALAGYVNGGIGACPASFDYCIDTNNATKLGVYNFSSFTLTKNVKAFGNSSHPLIIKSTGSVTISGTLDVSGGDASGPDGDTGGVGGPGGFSGGNRGYWASQSSSGSGPGGGPRGNYFGGDLGGSCGSGGGYGGAGGAGYYPPGTPVTSGGVAYGDVSISTLQGGSGGGPSGVRYASSAGAGGGGGGALKITAGVSITVSGIIKSNGGTVFESCPGGGSGGAILLESTSINISGSITANGGNGRSLGGRGGGGRVRLNASTITGASNITANAGSVGYSAAAGSISSNTALTYFSSGTYTSPIIDSAQKAKFTTIAITNSTGQTVKFKVRSSNNSDMSGATAWGSISYTTYSGSETTIPSSITGRYVQYMLELSGDTTATPTVDQVKVNYTHYPTGDAIADANTTFLAKFNSSVTADNGTLGTKTGTTTGSPEISGLDAKHGKGVYIENKGGLVGHWKMDGGFTDSSGSNDGTASGNAVATGAAKVGTASATFDGTGDYVTIGSIGTVKTVEFWINDTNATDGILELIDNATYISIAGGAITATGFTSPTVYVNGSSASATLAAGWNHVAVTTTTGISAASMVLGEANDDFMSGLLDDVAVSARVLSPEEVKLKYSTAVHSSSDNGLVGLWHFDGNANDSIGTNNGTGSVSYTTPKVGSKSLYAAYSSMNIPLDTRNFTAFTYMAWAKMGTSGTIFTNLSSIFGPGLHIAANGNANFAKMGASWGGAATGCSGMVNGQWGHVTVTFANGTLTSYYNGVPCTVTANTVGTWQATAAGISINTYAYNSNPFDAVQTVDEMMIFNKALSASKISMAYAGGGTSNSVMTKNSLKYTSASNIPVGSGNPGTIEMWVNPVWAGTDSVSHNFFTTGVNTTTPNYMHIAKSAGNNLNFHILDAAGNSLNAAVSGSSFTANTWHHIAATWDGASTTQLYLDGALVGTGTGTGNAYINTLPTNFYVGTDSTGNNAANAVVDDLRISSKVRTAKEIKDAYLANYYLISSPFDTNAASAKLTNLKWVEADITDSVDDALLQVRVSDKKTNLLAAPWSAAYTNGTAVSLDASGYTGNAMSLTGQWMQYRTLISSAGSVTPKVSAVRLTYEMPAFTVSGVSLNNQIISESSNATLTFTTSTTIDAGGSVTVKFPAGFDTSGATLGSTVCTTGTGASTSTDTFTITGCAEVTSATAMSVVINGVTNPNSGKPDIGAFTITSKNSAGALLDQSSYTETTPVIDIYGKLAIADPVSQVKNGLNGDVAASTLPLTNELIAFNLSATGENMNFSDLVVNLTYFGTGVDSTYFNTFSLVEDSSSGLDEIGVYNNEAVVASAVVSGSTLTFSTIGAEVLSVTPKNYLIVFNAAKLLAKGDGIKGTISGSSGVTGKGSGSNKTVTVSGTITGPDNRASGTLLLATSPTEVTNQLQATGGSKPLSEELVGFKLTTSDWEAATFTGLQISLNGTMAMSKLTNFRLYEDKGTPGTFDGSDLLVATKNSAPTGSTVTFPSFTDAISVSAYKNYLIIYDFNANAVVGETLYGVIKHTDITAIGASGGSATPAVATVSGLSNIHSVTGTLSLGDALNQVTNSLLNDNASADTNNELVAFNLKAAGEDVNISSMIIGINNDPSLLNLNNINSFKLYHDVDADGVFDISGDTRVTLTDGNPLNGVLNVTAKTITFSAFTASGDKDYIVIFNNNASLLAGKKITAVVTRANITGTGATSSGSLSISGSDVSNEPTHLVSTTITLAGVTQPANGLKYTGGTGKSDVALAGFKLTAGGGEDVTVSAVSVDLTLGGAPSSMTTSKLSGFKLYEYSDANSNGVYDSGEEGTLVSSSWGFSSSTVVFSSVSNIITASSTKSYVVLFTVSSTTNGNETVSASVLKTKITATGSKSTTIPLSGADVTATTTHKASGSLELGTQSVTVNSLRNDAGGASYDNELIGFSLLSKGETVNVSQIDLNLGFSNGMTFNDIQSVKLYVDTENAGEFLNESSVIFEKLVPSSNLISFTVSPLVSITKGTPVNYLVTFTAKSAANLAQKTINATLTMANITSTGNDSGLGIVVSKTADITGPNHISTGTVELSNVTTQVTANSLLSMAGETNTGKTTNLALAGFNLKAVAENMIVKQLVVDLTYGGLMDINKLSNFDLYLDNGTTNNLWDVSDTAVETGVNDLLVSANKYSVTFNPVAHTISSGTTNKYLLVFNADSSIVGGDSITGVEILKAKIVTKGAGSLVDNLPGGGVDFSISAAHKASGTVLLATDETPIVADTVGVYKSTETVVGTITLTPTGEDVNLTKFALNFTALPLTGTPATLGSGGDLTTVRVYKESGVSVGWSVSDYPLGNQITLASSVNYSVTTASADYKKLSVKTTYYVTVTGSATLAESEGIKVALAANAVKSVGIGSGFTANPIKSAGTYTGNKYIAPGKISGPVSGLPSVVLSTFEAGADTVTVTITGTTANTVTTLAGTGGKIKIVFPSDKPGFPFNLSTVTGSGTSGITASCSSGCAVGNVVTLNVPSDFPAGAFVIQLTGVKNPGISGDPGTWEVITTDNSGKIIDKTIGINGTDTILPGILKTNPEVVFNNYSAGAKDFATLTFKPTNTIKSGDKISLKFPNNLGNKDLSGIASPVGTKFDLSTVNSITGTNITKSSSFSNSSITLSGVNKEIISFIVGTQIDGSDSVSIKINNVTNPRVTGDLNKFNLETFSGGVSIGTGISTNSLSINNGVFNVLPTVTLNSDMAGKSDYVDIAYTSINPIPAGGKIKITFPTTLAGGFNMTAISSVTGSCTSFSALSNVLTVTCASAVTASALSPATVTLRVNNVKNPVQTGTIGTFKFGTYYDAVTRIDFADPVTPSPAAISTSHAFDVVSNVEPASLIVGATPATTVTFDPFNPLLGNGKIKVTFPAGFDLTAVSLGVSDVSSSKLTATGSVAISNINIATNTITVDRTGGTAISTLIDDLVITNIKNPTIIGLNSTYTVETTDNAGNSFDKGTALADTFKGEFTNIGISAYNRTGILSTTDKLWVVGREGTISWNITNSSTTTNKITAVKLVYIGDDGAENEIFNSKTDPTNANFTLTATSGSYKWTPTESAYKILTLGSTSPGNDPQLDPSDPVAIKIYDMTNVSDVNARAVDTFTNAFTAFFYKIQWKVRNDDIKTALLNGLTITSDTGWLTNTTGRDAADSLNANKWTIHYYPYGTYTSNWAKDGFSCKTTLGCGGTWAANKDKFGANALIVGMKNNSIKISYEMKLSVVYDESNDAIDVTGHLVEDGIILTKINLDDSGYTVNVNVFDPSNAKLNILNLATGVTPDAGGMFKGMIYKPSDEGDTPLSIGTTYLIKGSITYSGKTYNAAKTFTIPATGSYSVAIEPVYDSTNDAIISKVWLEKGGTVVEKTPTSLSFTVTPAVAANLTVSTFDTTSKTYTVTWKPTAGVTTTDVYTLTSVITYNKRTYTGNSVFSRSDAPDVVSIGKQVQKELTESNKKNNLLISAAVSDDLLKSGFADKISDSVSDDITALNKSQTRSIEEYIALKTKAISDNVVKILEDTSETLPDKIDTSSSDNSSSSDSKLLNRETSIITGDSITVRYQTDSGLSPTINVYDAKNNSIISNAAMVSGVTSGVYEYVLKLLTSYGLGDFTITTSNGKGNMDSMVLTVNSSDIDSIASQIAAGTITTDGIDSDGLASIDAVEENTRKMDNLTEQVDSVMDKLTKLTDALTDSEEVEGTDSGTEIFSKVATKDDISTLYKSIIEISTQLNSSSGDGDDGFGALFEISESNSESIEYLAEKAEELKVLIELNQQLLDRSVNKPIIKTWFEKE